jgi:uncharacterized membrane protein
MRIGKEELRFRNRLLKEMEQWLKEGILEPAQIEKILKRYELVIEAEEKAGPGKLITTLSVLGSILVGVGVILFVASNWSGIPKWGKLSIIYASMLGSYGLGFYCRYEKQNYPKVGASLILLGSLIFGAGLFLIAQVYHISVHYANGPLLWGLAVLPLAYFLRFKSLLSLAIVALLIWLGMESNFSIPEIVGLGVFFPLITLFLLAGIALWSVGLMHREVRSLNIISSPYILFGIWISFIAGYILTFDFSWSMRLGLRDLLIFCIGIAGLFIFSMIGRLLLKEREKGWGPEMAALFVLFGVIFSLNFFSHEVIPILLKKDYVIASNIVFALAITGIIVLGYLRRDATYVNTGLVFFVLDVGARYFDFFWELLPRSVFFILGGLMLLVGGILLEKKRKKILASFQIEEGDR